MTGTPASGVSAAAPPASAGYEVQVAAPRTRVAAQQIADRLARFGYRTHVEAGPGVFRVRIGPYPTLQAAQQAVARVRRRVTGRPFVVRP